MHRRWGEDEASAVYLSDARETHLLSPTCAHLLAILAQGPASEAGLLRALQHYLDGATDDEVHRQLGLILETLHRLGLLDALPEAA